MANDLNQCNFIGNLGADPETRFTQSGTSVTNFRIAVGWKTKDKEGTEWITVVAWGKLSEICAEFLRKGSKVFISGSMRTRKWQDQQDNDRYSTEIVADRMQMLDGRSSSDSAPQPQQQPRQQQPASAPAVDDFEDTDVPF